MSAPARRTVRGEAPTRDHLPEWAEDGDAFIVVQDGTIAERRDGTWTTVRGAGAEIDQVRARWYAALRDDDYDPKPYEIVDDFWPYDGPYSQWTTAAAATMLGRLVRYLNNATQKTSGLPNAPTIGNVLSGLNEALLLADQLLTQLDDAATRQADDPTLYDDRNPSGQGRDTALELARAVRAAAAKLADTGPAFNRAASLASHLGNRTVE